MTESSLSDCIRSTPARTLGALLIIGFQRLQAALRRSSMAAQMSRVDDRTLSDIGVSRLPAFAI